MSSILVWNVVVASHLLRLLRHLLVWVVAQVDCLHVLGGKNARLSIYEVHKILRLSEVRASGLYFTCLSFMNRSVFDFNAVVVAFASLRLSHCSTEGSFRSSMFIAAGSAVVEHLVRFMLDRSIHTLSDLWICNRRRTSLAHLLHLLIISWSRWSWRITLLFKFILDCPMI